MDEAHTQWAWQRLRLLRSSPPGLAEKSKARAELVSAALEQCEQLFAAARAVDTAARPLPLFYALSQATRAIAAVCLKRDFLIRRHGLSWLDAEPTLDPTHRVIAPEPHSTAAFARLCAALRSDTLTKPIDVGAVWRALPDLAVPALPVIEKDWLPALFVRKAQYQERVSRGSEWIELVVGPLEEGEDANGLRSTMARYPSLAAFEPTVQDQDRSQLAWVALGHSLRGAVIRAEQERDGGRLSYQINDTALLYQGQSASRYVIPVFSTGDQLPPLALWWALLFALSNLARYEPDMWVRAIDVDRSPWAVPLEDCLNVAIVALPHLILEALLQRTVVAHSYE